MLDYRRIMLALGLLLAVGMLACSIDMGAGGAVNPTVEILSPPSGSRVAPGEDLEVQYRATDAVAIVRVELEVNGQIVDVEISPAADGELSISGTLRWTPTTPGTYSLLVYAHNRDGAVSDAVGLDIIVSPPPPESTPVSPKPTHTLALPTPVPPTPTHTLVPPTPAPQMPTHTLVPPTPAPPTPTHTPELPTPVPPTPTHTPIGCPGIAINVPSHAYPSRIFTLEWDSYPHAIPSGWEWGIRFKGAEADWTYLPVPLDPPAREEAGHWKADYLRGRGNEETLYWQACLVNSSDPARAFECCGPVPPWSIIHTR